MKCMMSSDGTHIVRVSDDEASELYHNENFKYVAKSVWKEKVRDLEIKDPCSSPTILVAISQSSLTSFLSVIPSFIIKNVNLSYPF